MASPKKSTKKQDTPAESNLDKLAPAPKTTGEAKLGSVVPNDAQISPEAQKKMEEIQKILEKFKDKIVDRFEGYVGGVGLLPPGKIIEEMIEPEMQQAQQSQQHTKLPQDHINTLVLIDDTEPTKMSKQELKDRLEKVILEQAASVDKRLYIQVLLQTELMQFCFDQKYDLIQLIASAAPVLDRGMLAAFKITEVHKAMVLKKFEKYIVSYVLAGSLVQGKATASSDIDVFIVIDDTDVKRMTRAELKDKLRSIIIGMGAQAGEMTGIKNKLNIQAYILTDFWDSIKEANPVIFTFLRDGVPLYDRGIFLPWKQLLKMGKVKPSMEAIDMYMSTGEQMLDRAKFKLKEIGMEDTFWSILYPSQAALMLFGLPPPTPKETPQLLRKVFVKKEKMLEDKYVKILENNIQLRKDLEHGSKKEITGVELDKVVKDAADFLVRIRKLFDDIQEKQQGRGIVHTYDHVTTIMRDALKLSGVKSVTDAKLEKTFQETLTDTNKLPQRVITLYQHLFKAKKDFDKGDLHKSEIERARTDSQELIRTLIEFIQRERGLELERAKIKVKYGDKFGEVILMDKQAFVVHDIDAPSKTFSKATITKDGKLIQVSESDVEEFEKAIVEGKFPQRVFIKESTLNDLKKIFGKDVEVLMHY